MRPNADDVRLARWVCVCVCRGAAAGCLIVSLSGAALRVPQYLLALAAARNGYAPSPSLRSEFFVEGVLAIVGALLLVASLRAVNFIVPAPTPKCPHCGYDMKGSTTGTCPECGKA